jgi:hypothetical protein
MMPCSKFYLGVKNFLLDIKKKGSKHFSAHKPVKLRIKNMGETLIFGPISVKFMSINSIQFPLKAL